MQIKTNKVRCCITYHYYKVDYTMYPISLNFCFTIPPEKEREVVIDLTQSADEEDDEDYLPDGLYSTNANDRAGTSPRPRSPGYAARVLDAQFDAIFHNATNGELTNQVSIIREQAHLRWTTARLHHEQILPSTSSNESSIDTVVHNTSAARSDEVVVMVNHTFICRNCTMCTWQYAISIVKTTVFHSISIKVSSNFVPVVYWYRKI